MNQDITFKIASREDLPALKKVGNKLFDNPVKDDRAKEFLSDQRHHLVLACINDQVVGMASGFHYIHPDKDPELFINEVAVIDEFQNQQIGRQLITYLFEYCKNLGCREAWVLTDSSNSAARRAYLAAGGTENEDEIKLISFK